MNYLLNLFVKTNCHYVFAGGDGARLGAGEQAPASLVAALHQVYALAQQPGPHPPVDAILLVRGGASMEDLWAFNDEALAHTIVQLLCH